MIYNKLLNLKGKQHGIGLYYMSPKEVKVGEWQEGKRIKWFQESEIERLKQKNLLT